MGFWRQSLAEEKLNQQYATTDSCKTPPNTTSPNWGTCHESHLFFHASYVHCKQRRVMTDVIYFEQSKRRLTGGGDIPLLIVIAVLPVLLVMVVRMHAAWPSVNYLLQFCSENFAVGFNTRQAPADRPTVPGTPTGYPVPSKWRLKALL